MGNIEIQYPFWSVLLCLLLGGAFAFLLYYRAQYFPTARGWVKSGLGFIRFASISLLSLLLLSPVLKTSKQESKKPIVVVAQDVSASIREEMDSNALREYATSLMSVAEDLSEDYEVRTYAFGENIRDGLSTTFNDKSSNQSSMLRHIGDLYGDQNLGAVIFATDGIYNEGSDPLYSNAAFSAPVYTIAMGDTTPDKDLYIRQIYHNNIAYLGDKSGVQIDVSAYNFEGQRVTLQVFHIEGDNNGLVQSETFTIGAHDFFQTFELSIPQESIGLQRFRVSLSPVSGEKSISNNRKDFFIDVIDARQKILMLAASPHPDVTALKASLEENKNYEVTSMLARDFAGNLEEYDFVVLHQLPSARFRVTPLLRSINEKNIPKLIIVGAQTNMAALNQFQSLVNIKPKGSTSNVVEAMVNPGFSPFTTTDDLKNQIASFAPIDAPFADYQVDPGADVLLRQRIGKVETDFPLWVIGDESESRTAIVCAEGLWRWRMYDYLQNDNYEIFNEILGKTVQYLTLKEDKRKFRVFQANNLLNENEDALFDAELYNQSYELINDPEVNMIIYNSKGEAFNFGFSKRNNGYYLDAGRLPVDDYRWTASTQYEGERYSASGQFSVQAIEKESFVTVANHNMLAQLSNNSNGTMIYPDQVSSLTEMIKGSGELKPILYRVFQSTNAINLKWLFYVLLGLLVIEWGLRRFLGTY